MTKRIIIIGKHPITECLVKQYEAKGGKVDQQEGLTTEGVLINDYDEVYLLAGDGEDDKAVAMLAKLADDYRVESHGGKRLVCHLLLQSNQKLRMLQTCDLCDAVRQKIDVYPFSMDEMWSRDIVLDYKPVTMQSEKHVHLVVFGMNEIAEMVAIQAALVAPYPNYIRNHSLRTRITMVDEQAELKSDTIIKRYQHLFDNSFYRKVRPSEEKAVVAFHKPMYDGRREDFVDVEWEFVEAESWNVGVREKLQRWAKDEQQLLTVVLAGNDAEKNKSMSLLMPSELYEQHIPIYIYGQHDCSYDVTMPLVRMAKNVNYIYDRCYAENYSQLTIEQAPFSMKYAVEIDSEERERSWAKLSNVKRMSSIYNAMTIATKMRSIGLEEKDWDDFYDIPQQDIEMLAQVEHNRWSVEELILGFRPCTDDEQTAIEADIRLKAMMKKKKIHYDLRAYNDLRPDETGKPVEGVRVAIRQHRHYDNTPDVIFGQNDWYENDTLYTDSNGAYELSKTIFDKPKDVRIVFEDIDGAENGGEFESAEAAPEIKQTKKGDKSWYGGAFEVQADVTLKKK